MAQLLISSQDETIRALLALIGQDHHFVVTVVAHPLEALRLLEASMTPIVALFDVWLDRWDDEAGQRLARFSQIPTQHVAVVLWDAHIALPPAVRAEFAAQRVLVVKKPLDLTLLDAALDEAARQVKVASAIQDALAFDDGPATSLH